MGEESVAWAAGRGEALTQSLVTHWARGHKACHLKARNTPTPTSWPPVLPSISKACLHFSISPEPTF